MDLLRSAAWEAVRVIVSDDHNADGGEAALRAIIAGVAQTGGTQALADLAFDLAMKRADTTERIAERQGLLAADVLDIMFIDAMM
jgi:hypothetical protein